MKSEKRSEGGGLSLISSPHDIKEREKEEKDQNGGGGKERWRLSQQHGKEEKQYSCTRRGERGLDSAAREFDGGENSDG